MIKQLTWEMKIFTGKKITVKVNMPSSIFVIFLTTKQEKALYILRWKKINALNEKEQYKFGVDGIIYLLY